jgi:hypothetical protein
MLLAARIVLGQTSLVDTSAPPAGVTSAPPVVVSGPPAVVTLTTLIPTNSFGVGLTNAFNADTNAPPTEETEETEDTEGTEAEAVEGTFLVTRDGELTNDLVVFYTVSGTAVAGTDYETITNQVTIPADEETATITVRPILTNTAVPVAFNSTVQLDLMPPTNDPPTYTIGSPSNAVVTIGDLIVSDPGQLDAIELIAPRSGVLYPEGGDILLAAVASGGSVTVTNGDGTVVTTNQEPFVTDSLSNNVVSNIEFFANTTSVGQGTPVFLEGTDEEGNSELLGAGVLYVLEWTAVPAGDYFITAVGTDASGVVRSISTPVAIAVRPRL